MEPQEVQQAVHLQFKQCIRHIQVQVSPRAAQEVQQAALLHLSQIP